MIQTSNHTRRTKFPINSKKKKDFIPLMNGIVATGEGSI